MYKEGIQLLLKHMIQNVPKIGIENKYDNHFINLRGDAKISELKKKLRRNMKIYLRLSPLKYRLLIEAF